MISLKLKTAVKMHALNQYRIGQKAGLSQATMSHIMTGTTPVKDGDWRVIAIGEVVGVGEGECFEK